MPIEKYIVTIDRPYRCNIGEVKQYIEDAINSMRGCFSRDDERIGIECVDIKKQTQNKGEK